MKQLLKNIRRLIAWAPIIWADRDWDYAFLLRIMAFKMRRMADKIGSANRHDDSKKVQNQLLMCAETCRFLSGDRGIAEVEAAWAAHEERWGTLKLEYGAALPGASNLPVTTRYSKALNAADNEKAKKAASLIFELEYEREKEAAHKLFRCMRRNYRRWWD